MRTLIFDGSPRKCGNTAGLIALLLDGLRGEAEIVNAYYDDISPCIDCRHCHSFADCAQKDRMTDVYELIEESDNIIIASPIYFSQLTGRMLDVGSRLQRYFCARFFRGESIIKKPKRGGVILVGGGDGSALPAEKTAAILLRQMNCRDIFPTVLSHHTEIVPAYKDQAAVEKLKELAAFLNSDS